MKLGIIGGSGLYDIPGLEEVETTRVDTPYGAPSGALVRGRLGGVELLFLPRHGQGHTILPSEINHRANLFAFKQLGAGQLLAITAVGSLQAEIAPRDVVLPDQYFDRTKRNCTFFGDGVAAHAPFADPVCPRLRRGLREALEDLPRDGETVRVHLSGTYVNIEGPAFSTRAESRFYQAAGFDVIGMTSLPEAKLARELGLCYAPVALVTDFDAWHQDEEAVTVEMVMGHMKANIKVARELIASVIARLNAEGGTCGCAESMQGAVMTDPKLIDPETRERLGI